MTFLLLCDHVVDDDHVHDDAIRGGKEEEETQMFFLCFIMYEGYCYYPLRLPRYLSLSLLPWFESTSVPPLLWNLSFPHTLETLGIPYRRNICSSDI